MSPRTTYIPRLAALAALALACALLLAQAAFPPPASLSPALVVSASTGGRYVISSHQERELVLWNIKARTHQVISREANIYSAYFIPGREAFLWQDLSDTVRVSAVDGTELLRFKHFPTYGHLISSDLGTYISSDQGWGIHLGWGDTAQPIKASDGLAALGFGKLLNLQLDPDSGLLLSAGYGYNFDDKDSLAEERDRGRYQNIHGIAVWSIDQLEPLHKLPGNSAKTHATLSPDGKFVVSVDENAQTFVWSALDGQPVYEPALLGMGLYAGGHELGSPKNWDTQGMHLHPDDLPQGLAASAQLGVRFLDPEHYVILHTYQPYAVLYTLGDPFALKILPLGEEPFPSVSSYLRNAAIDAAPEAGILVTGQRDGGGINVYRFDRRSRSLARIWAPTP